VVRLARTDLRPRYRDTGAHAAFPHDPADRHRLFLQAAIRIEEDRNGPGPGTGEKGAEPGRRAFVELAIGRDPFAAARPARFLRTALKEESQRLFRELRLQVGLAADGRGGLLG